MTGRNHTAGSSNPAAPNTSAAGSRSASFTIDRPSYVEFVGLFRPFHDEPEPRGGIPAHQLVDDPVGRDLTGDLDSQQPPCAGIERRPAPSRSSRPGL
jgi:hypothetical protein